MKRKKYCSPRVNEITMQVETDVIASSIQNLGDGGDIGGTTGWSVSSTRDTDSFSLLKSENEVEDAGLFE